MAPTRSSLLSGPAALTGRRGLLHNWMKWCGNSVVSAEICSTRFFVASAWTAIKRRRREMPWPQAARSTRSTRPTRCGPCCEHIPTRLTSPSIAALRPSSAHGAGYGPAVMVRPKRFMPMRARGPSQSLDGGFSEQSAIRARPPRSRWPRRRHRCPPAYWAPSTRRRSQAPSPWSSSAHRSDARWRRGSPRGRR